MKINYQLDTDRILDKLADRGEVPRLLLHACCGPCSGYVLEYLARHFDITVLYYNPNIRPRDEYLRRLDALESLAARLPVERTITLVEDGHRSEDFDEILSRSADEPEGGARCAECIALRLGEAARAAQKYSCDYFCSTLTISPRKNAQLINTIGSKVAETVGGTIGSTDDSTNGTASGEPTSGVVWLPSDFKKREGYARSAALSRKYGLYRQNYCGCTPREPTAN